MSADVINFPEKSIRGWPPLEAALRKMLAVLGLDAVGIEAVIESSRIAYVDIMSVQVAPSDSGEAAVIASNAWVVEIIGRLMMRLAAADMLVYETRGMIPRVLPDKL